MSNVIKDDALFNGLVALGASEAMRRELDALPSNEELNAMYKTDELDARIFKMIERDSKKRKWEPRQRFAMRIVSTFAIVFTVLTSALMSVEASRVWIINAVLDWQADHVVIRPEIGNRESENNIRRPQYLPKGFYETESLSFGTSVETIYSNDKGIDISFLRHLVEGTEPHIDTEHSDYQQITISGNEAHLFVAHSSEYYSKVIWIAGDMLYELSSEIDYKELVLMAESVD